MRNELAKVERHIDTGIGAAKRLAIEIDTQGAMQFHAVPTLAQPIGRYEHWRKGAGRFGLEKAETLGEFARDQGAQRDIVGQSNKPDRLSGFGQRRALWDIAHHDNDFGFHIATPVFIGQRYGVACAEKAIRSALIHQRVMPETIRHLGIARLTDQRDMVHIGRAIGPLVCARKRCGGIAFMKTHHRNRLMRQVGSKVAQRRFQPVPVIQRRLKRWGDMGCVCAPGEIVRNDEEMAIAARFERSQFHDRDP